MIFPFLLILLINCYGVTSFRREPFCHTEHCHTYANKLKNLLNEEADPCEDFYEFSCGTFKKITKDFNHDFSSFHFMSHNLKMSLKSMLTSPLLPTECGVTKKTKSFYKSCMNLDETEKSSESYLVDTINTKLGGWPLLTSKENPFSTEKILSNLARLNIHPFIEIVVTTNPKNRQQKMIKLRQPVSMNKREFYQSTDYYSSFMTFSKNVLSYLNSTNANLHDDIEKLIKISFSFSHILMDQFEIKSSPSPKKYDYRRVEPSFARFSMEIVYYLRRV